MFGLTKREQRWTAEQRAAELLVGFAQSTVCAVADIRIAEANAALERLRKENAELRAAAGVKVRGATQPCSLGVGCDEAGVCYAEAHGQPERCPNGAEGDSK